MALRPPEQDRRAAPRWTLELQAELAYAATGEVAVVRARAFDVSATGAAVQPLAEVPLELLGGPVTVVLVLHLPIAPGCFLGRTLGWDPRRPEVVALSFVTREGPSHDHLAALLALSQRQP